MFMTIDAQKCKRDGLCSMACPMGLIVPNKEKFPEPVPDAEKFCVGCGHCVAVCPHDALSLTAMQPQSLPLIKKELIPSKETLEQTLKTRRSIRQYKDQSVPHDILANLLDITRWAPTAANVQPVNLLVIEKKEEVKKLAGLIAEGFRKNNLVPPLVEAWDKGKDVFLRNAPHVIIAHANSTTNYMPLTDCAIALTFLDVMAPTYGLGTCWAGVLMIAANAYPPLVEFLKLPKDHKIYGAMMLGYPKYSYRRIPQRKPSKLTWM